MSNMNVLSDMFKKNITQSALLFNQIITANTKELHRNGIGRTCSSGEYVMFVLDVQVSLLLVKTILCAQISLTDLIAVKGSLWICIPLVAMKLLIMSVPVVPVLFISYTYMRTHMRGTQYAFLTKQ